MKSHAVFLSAIAIVSIIHIASVRAEPTAPQAPYIDKQVVKGWQAENKPLTIIDVREASEYEVGHIDGAINIPYRELEDQADRVPTKEPAVFYCIHSSWRAPYAANLFADKGYENVYVLEGGIAAWNAGGQVIKPTANMDDNKGPEIAPYPKDLPKELSHPPSREYKTKIDLTTDQLAEFNGQNGRPAYVAVAGTIYDVTQSRLWRGGVHDPSHGEGIAGRDLTELIKQSPHGPKNLDRFPVVGKVIQ